MIEDRNAVMSVVHPDPLGIARVADLTSPYRQGHRVTGSQCQPPVGQAGQIDTSCGLLGSPYTMGMKLTGCRPKDEINVPIALSAFRDNARGAYYCCGQFLITICLFVFIKKDSNGAK